MSTFWAIDAVRRMYAYSTLGMEFLYVGNIPRSVPDAALDLYSKRGKV